MDLTGKATAYSQIQYSVAGYPVRRKHTHSNDCDQVALIRTCFCHIVKASTIRAFSSTVDGKRRKRYVSASLETRKMTLGTEQPQGCLLEQGLVPMVKIQKACDQRVHTVTGPFILNSGVGPMLYTSTLSVPPASLSRYSKRGPVAESRNQPLTVKSTGESAYQLPYSSSDDQLRSARKVCCTHLAYASCHRLCNSVPD